MQQAFLQTAGLAARLWLAVFFMGHVAQLLLPGALGSFDLAVGTGTRLLDLAAMVFFALVALWLVLGIYSRIVAITGMVVCGAAILLFGEPSVHTGLVVSVAATLVLAFTGGGRLRLHAGGWRLRGCL